MNALALMLLLTLQDPSQQQPAPARPEAAETAPQRPTPEAQEPANPAGAPATPAAPAPSTAPNTAPGTANEGWVVLDSAALIVNEDIITDVEVIAELRRALKPSSTEADRNRARASIVGERVRNLLQQQAGQLMGYDQKMVERFVQDQIDRQREEAGGVARLASELKARNLDSFTHRDSIRTHAYGMLWQRSQMGIDPGPKGRVAADRYVRPGRLYFEFARRQDDLANDPLVTVHTVGLKIVRSADDVKSALEELRAAVEASGDFDGELAKFDGGRLQPEVLADRGLSAFRSNKELHEFLKDAAPGTVSPVLEIREREVLTGYRLVFLSERKARPKPDFQDPKIQNGLRDEVRTDLDDLRVGAGLEKLHRAAYVWPPEALGREATIEN
ncbi:MAG: hypothetical protein L6Q99_01805 [Planctomycetes bacterium]|nr:hypothetical protein [Planctomycetota bacterium]